MPFTFDAGKLCVGTPNGKFWTRAKEVSSALKYQNQIAHVIRDHASAENFTYRYQLIKLAETDTFANWPKDSRKDDYYINEEGMYALSFFSQQPKAKDFRKHCCNVLYPHVRQQLTKKMEENHKQTINGIQREHQLAIADRDDQIRAIQYENVALQALHEMFI